MKRPPASGSGRRDSLVMPTAILIIVFAMFGYQEYKIRGLEVRLEQQVKLQLKSAMALSALQSALQSKGSSGLNGNIYLETLSPPAMPSVLTSEQEEKSLQKKRGIYGGVGDAAHLGGFTKRDNMTISENMWNFMLSQLAVKSILDLGCGKGFSANFFLKRGAKVLCVEGSHDAVTQSLLPKDLIVEHDFSRGPWWPEETFDVAYSTEFVEHVGRQYMKNYYPIFKKAAIVMFTSSAFGGWHHVEIHKLWWWQSRMEAHGFIFSEVLTEQMAQEVRNEQFEANNMNDGQILRHGIKVFINPSVASLPKHKHLFGGHGCFDGAPDNNNGGKPCMGVDRLPADYMPLIECKKEKTKWRDLHQLPWYNISWTCNTGNPPQMKLPSELKSKKR